MDQLIPLLLFADDLALCSLSHAGFQAQLDILQDFCTARGLVVNVKKTKIMIFEQSMQSEQCYIRHNAASWYMLQALQVLMA